jgi:hypothetical protein
MRLLSSEKDLALHALWLWQQNGGNLLSDLCHLHEKLKAIEKQRGPRVEYGEGVTPRVRQILLEGILQYLEVYRDEESMRDQREEAESIILDLSEKDLALHALWLWQQNGGNLLSDLCHLHEKLKAIEKQRGPRVEYGEGVTPRARQILLEGISQYLEVYRDEESMRDQREEAESILLDLLHQPVVLEHRKYQ